MKFFVYTIAASLMFIATITASANFFDGAYSFKIKTTRGSCTASSGIVKVEEGKITGTLKSDGTIFKISGKIKQDGSLKGRISGGVATFKGNFENGILRVLENLIIWG